MKGITLASLSAVLAGANQCMDANHRPLPDTFHHPSTGEYGACIAVEDSKTYSWHSPWESNALVIKAGCHASRVKYDCFGYHMQSLLALYAKSIEQGTTAHGTSEQTMSTVKCIHKQCPNLKSAPLPKVTAAHQHVASQSKTKSLDMELPLVPHQLPQHQVPATTSGACHTLNCLIKTEARPNAQAPMQPTQVETPRATPAPLPKLRPSSLTRQPVIATPQTKLPVIASPHEVSPKLRSSSLTNPPVSDDEPSPKLRSSSLTNAPVSSSHHGAPTCMVLPGIGGMIVQGILLACCIAVFYYKRKHELLKLGEDARSNEEFFLDASKQAVAAGWIHVMNLCFASLLNSITAGADECEWYWINIMLDTTVGTLVSYVFLQIATAFIRKRFSAEAAQDFVPGEYRSPGGVLDVMKYFKQLCVWLIVVFAMKFTMVISMFLFSGPLLKLAGTVLAPFLSEPWLKLLVVMIVFPVLMDAFQIWMVDNFLKKRLHNTDVGAESSCVEAAADALLACGQKCELTAEHALMRMRSQANEIIVPEQDAFSPSKSQDTYLGSMHSQHSGANFETQLDYANLATRIEPSSDDKAGPVYEPLQQEQDHYYPQSSDSAFDTQYLFQTRKDMGE